MNWYVDIVYMDGESGRMYYHTRAEARRGRRHYLNEFLHTANPVMTATIRKAE